jgi:hypothetical protein
VAVAGIGGGVVTGAIGGTSPAAGHPGSGQSAVVAAPAAARGVHALSGKTVSAALQARQQGSVATANATALAAPGNPAGSGQTKQSSNPSTATTTSGQPGGAQPKTNGGQTGAGQGGTGHQSGGATTPAVNLPKINLPKPTLPKLQLPKLQLPKIQLPKIQVPKISVPGVGTPKKLIGRLLHG